MREVFRERLDVRLRVVERFQYFADLAVQAHPPGRAECSVTDLSGFDIPPAPAENRWQTHMDKIEVNVLRSGTNTIQILRASGEDNFVILDLVVQWKRTG